MKRRIAFYTFGCRLNQSETASVVRSFDSKRYEVVGIRDPADIVVINTCTVTENGDSDARRLVNRARRLNPDTRIALIGCQAQTQKDQLTSWPNVKWVVGNERKMELARILDEHDDSQTHLITPTISREAFTIPFASVDPQHTRANIKIQDGCDFFCSFCEIPYARGRARSRVFDDIAREARQLADAGHRELVITGINVGTYAHKGNTIVDVIDMLEQIAKIDRIRISSIEPTTIPRQVIEKMRGDSKVCRHLHIPLQSANDDVLSEMKRKYSWREFIEFIENAAAAIPHLCLGTDIIVGFPGETQQQFEDTVQKFKDAPFTYAHIFSYSRRTLARSRTREDIPVPEIQRRSEILRNLSQRKREAFHQSLIGTGQTVLFESRKDEYWSGLTDNYVRVSLKNEDSLLNELRPVRLRRIMNGRLLGELN